MRRHFLILLILVPGSLTLSLLLGQPTAPDAQAIYDEYKKVNRLYEYADNASETRGVTIEEEERLNEEVRTGFLALLTRMDQARLPFDSLRFFCEFKVGEIDHYFGRLHDAQLHYLRAIEVKRKNRQESDTTLFRPLLYSGNIYYNLGSMDSALGQFKEAERIAALFTQPLQETGRLYNSLGALFYETGNYRQARNYFAKAVATLPRSDINYKEFYVSYNNNLAATLTKLEEFDEAIQLYKELLPYNISRHEILHNMGTINLNLGSVRRSLEYFRQVPMQGPVAPRLANNFALAFYQLNELDSCQRYLTLADRLNTEWNGKRKNSTYGLTLKYQADYWMLRADPQKALEYYHKAIIQFDNDFNNPDIYINPGGYSGIFSYINLFNTLSAKAAAFQTWFEKNKDQRLLVAALDAYKSAFRLADYVERNYDSDEARLFLNRIKYNVHHKPIDLCIALHRLNGDKKYLEEAYFFDQRNKASILSLNVQEAASKSRGDIPLELIEQEKKIRSQLTRLSIKAANLTDSSKVSALNTQIRDQEIELGRIQDRMKAVGVNQDFAIADRIPSLQKVQEKILDNKTALLSFHLSETDILAYVITRSGLEYKLYPIDKGFYPRIDSFLQRLRQTGNGDHRRLTDLSLQFYQQLILPLRPALQNFTRLIIIPDDELNYVPFETLQDETGRYLLQDFSIQYLFTTALLDERTALARHQYRTLGFAPFRQKGIPGQYDALPWSENELKGLSGKILFDEKAVRDSLMFYANQYPLIHFATHARADDNDPLQSYISFYPADSQYRLFAREIYDLRLDSTELVILSACETGTGRLVHGEGMMSLTRAFSYAGCPNIIASLWKAEDRSTSFITRKLHDYLDKGYTKDAALRQAKLDLLEDETLDPLLKTPEYWGHLIYIGQYETPARRSWWSLAWPALVITLILASLSFVRKSKKLTP